MVSRDRPHEGGHIATGSRTPGMLARPGSLVTILALSLAGCVPGADAPSPTDPHGLTTTTTLASTTITQTRDEGLGAFQQCMSDEGLPVPEIPRDSGGRPRMASALQHVDLTDRAALDALEVCGVHLESGALDLSTDPEMQRLVQAVLQDLVACLRSRGVDDFPEPVSGYDGLGSPFPTNRIPWSDPDLPAAVEDCADLPS